MNQKAKSIRPFIGAINFEISRNFYLELGFQESMISHNMSYFNYDGFGFYLQDAYIKDWIDNSMIFLEVEDTEHFYSKLLALNLPSKYKNVKLTPIRYEDWGKECFLHDPSGILWHIGEFLK